MHVTDNTGISCMSEDVIRYNVIHLKMKLRLKFHSCLNWLPFSKREQDPMLSAKHRKQIKTYFRTLLLIVKIKTHAWYKKYQSHRSKSCLSSTKAQIEDAWWSPCVTVWDLVPWFSVSFEFCGFVSPCFPVRSFALSSLSPSLPVVCGPHRCFLFV